MLTSKVITSFAYIAGWSSLEARRAHNPKVTGSNPVPAIITAVSIDVGTVFLYHRKDLAPLKCERVRRVDSLLYEGSIHLGR